MRSPRLTTAPGTPVVGEMYYDSTGNLLKYWNGTTWVTSGTPTGVAGTPILTGANILDVGVSGQIRAGRQLTAGDFTALGLSAPRGLWNLSDLTDASGNGRTLTNKGTVTFASGINGTATTAAQFTGSTAQALYISDTGGADPFRIATGSVGCWFRTAKRGTYQHLLSKVNSGATSRSYEFYVNTSNGVTANLFVDPATTSGTPSGVSDVADDRWHLVVVTFDGTAVRAYVDAVLEGTASVTGALNGSTGPLNIGGYGADGSTAAANPHYGRVDEAFITADVLSDDQVRALYCAKVAHGLAATPAAFNLAVRRQRKGGAFAVGDFPAQPLRLHNFTAGALTDQGSNNVALTNNGAAVAVAGADGALGNAFNFLAASSQSLSSTDAGLPSGTATRSYGCWFKVSSTAVVGMMGWGTQGTGQANLYIGTGGVISCNSVGDSITGPFVADGQWHSVIVVEDNAAGDGVKRKLYLDGRLSGSSLILNAITLAGANRFRVGANPDGTSPMSGQVDGAFVCGYALTQDQISTLYAKGSQTMPTSVKNPGDHIEYADATNIYLATDTLDTQHQLDLAVTG
jgi:hypothetical protein